MGRIARPAALAASIVALCAVATGCGGKSARDRVQEYVKQANAVEQTSTPAFSRAQASYVAFARGQLAPTAAATRLASAEAAIRAARGKLAALHPPADAQELHRLLLAVFDRNIELADETLRLARYSPAAAAALRPLTSANRHLSSDLSAAAGKDGQRQALARYSAALGRVLAALRRLQPPPLLAPAHRAQLKRLGSARSLAIQLERAIGAGDARRTATLLLRFRRVGAGSTGAALSPAALRAYRDRYRAISAAEQELRSEEARLQRKLR